MCPTQLEAVVFWCRSALSDLVFVQPADWTGHPVSHGVIWHHSCRGLYCPANIHTADVPETLGKALP